MSLSMPYGPVTNALTHFALYGLAAIIETETGQSARLYWTDDAQPKARIETDIGPDEIAAAVHRHATKGASPHSWLAVRVEHEGRDTAAFSPRIKEPQTPSAWQKLQNARHTGLDAVLAADADELDLRMIGALGEPAYWPTDRNADAGATRWEMKTRNRGEEFVGNRLALLAHAVADRTTEEILSGLTGQTVNDEVGKNKPESRTATGLARPGPVDNALAWCALWGISQCPVVHHNGAQSATAGTFVLPHRAYPSLVFLPVPTHPVTLSRLRTILASRHLPLAALADTTTDPLQIIDSDAARKWLTERSVRALMCFDVDVSDNPTAPERHVLDGRVITLTECATPWT